MGGWVGRSLASHPSWRLRNLLVSEVISNSLESLVSFASVTRLCPHGHQTGFVSGGLSAHVCGEAVLIEEPQSKSRGVRAGWEIFVPLWCSSAGRSVIRGPLTAALGPSSLHHKLVWGLNTLVRSWSNCCKLCKPTQATEQPLSSVPGPLQDSTDLVLVPAAVRTLCSAAGGSAGRRAAGWWRRDGCSPHDSFYQHAALGSEEHLTSLRRRVDLQIKPFPSALGGTFWSFAATVYSDPDSPGLQARPGHGEPLRAAAAP